MRQLLTGAGNKGNLGHRESTNLFSNFSLWAHIPVQRRFGHTQCRADFLNDTSRSFISRTTIFSLSGVISLGRPPMRPRARAARNPALRSFPDQVTLKFGQCRKHMKLQFACRRSCVDIFVQTAKTDLALLQLFDSENQTL